MTTNTPAPAMQEAVLTDGDILHHWDAYVGEPSAALPLSDADKIAFARAIESTLLSKLRAPVADERAAFEHAERASNLERDEEDDYMNPCVQSSWEGWQARAALESAPVAGDAYQGDNVAERLDNMADDQPLGSQAQSDLYAAATIWRKHIAHRAAPQASEAVCIQVLAALEAAQRFIRNGVEFGYIRMPGADTPDPAHQTPGLIDAAIRALSAQPGAQKETSDEA